MGLLDIRVMGDPVLTNRALEVEVIDGSLDRLFDDMIATMNVAPGVGLAAPQVGVAKRFFVYDIGDGPGVVVNPVIQETSGLWTYEEGCLSVPGYFWEVQRPNRVVMTGLDRNGKEQVIEGSELLGRVLQHELDHLDGVLLIERLDVEAKQEAKRRFRESLLGD
ncbi:MAG: peptide deformylase [Ferrimicrobium sp.]